MGRSVDYLSCATAVIYVEVPTYWVESFTQIINEIEYRFKGWDEREQENWEEYKTKNNSEISFAEWCLLTLEQCEEDDEDDDSRQQAWDDFKGNLICGLEAKYKSLTRPSKERWDGRETKIILENNLVEVGLSEYCGLASVSLRPNEYYQDDAKVGLAENWINKVKAGMEKKIGEFATVLYRQGTFSNGEGVYAKA